jgi:LAO/AO transport system kinase
MRVVAATGTPWIVVETVGVGQVELDVAAATDTTVVVVNPGWGDGVQASKAGLLEVADVFAVNKADRPGADAAVRDLRAMQELSAGGGWTPPIVETVAITADGVDQLWDAVLAHRSHLVDTGSLERRRRERFDAEVRQMVKAHLLQRADAYLRTPRFDALVDDEWRGAVDPREVATRAIAEALGTTDGA